MIQRGRVHIFGENINTDYIISAKHKESKLKIEDMIPHLMEDIEPDFHKKINQGDFILAGRNFGCGSSREAAPALLKAAGIAGVLSPLFARIFYRNAINVGLPVLEFENAHIEAGEWLTVDYKNGIVHREKTKESFAVQPLPDFMLKIVETGGLVPYLREYGQFNLKV